MKVALERRVGEVVKVSVFGRDQRGIEDVVAKDSGIGNIAQCGHFHRGRSHVWRIEHVYGNEAIASINASKLVFNQKAGCVVAIDLGATSVDVALCDLGAS